MAGMWDGNVYSGDDTDEKVAGTSAGEILSGAGGNDTLRGGGGNDQLFGNTSFNFVSDTVDKLYGEDGNDFLEGAIFAKAGSLIDGGTGVDIANIGANFSSLPDVPVSFTLAQKGSHILVDGDETLYVKGIETLLFRGSGSQDHRR